MPRIKQPILKRVMQYIDKTDSCWIWKGAATQYGYGSFSVSGQDGKPAHRAVYEILIGKIDDGMTLDHLCFNKLCVNPEHLEQVSHAENTRRRKSTKLSYEKVKEIKDMIARGYKQKEVAYIFGINKSQVSRVINEKRWRIA